MSALSTLRDMIGGRPQQYVPSLDPFLELDVDALAAQLELEAEGTRRGEAELPPSDIASMDDIELGIVERIENEASRVYRECVHELRTIDGRLNSLDLEGSFTTARAAATSATAEFVAEARLRQGHLTAKRKAVQQAGEFLEEFRQENKLRRLAHSPIHGMAYWGVLSGAVVTEAAINSIFLRVNDDLGYLGGAVMAFAIAVVNVFIATVFGKFVMPQKNSVKQGVQVRATVLLLLYVVFALSLNLVGAHFRYLKGTGVDDPGGAAIASFLVNPVGIPDFISWLLVAFGLGCSFLALWAGYRSDDEYPGYGRATGQYEGILDGYNTELEHAHDALGSIKDEATELAMVVERKLARDRREYEAALLSRSSLIALYNDRHPNLETAANRLLGIYRTANRIARTTASPKHFDERWRLRPLAEPAALPSVMLSSDEMDSGLASTRTALTHAVEKINESFVRHIEGFKPIDDVLV